MGSKVSGAFARVEASQPSPAAHSHSDAACFEQAQMAKAYGSAFAGAGAGTAAKGGGATAGAKGKSPGGKPKGKK